MREKFFVVNPAAEKETDAFSFPCKRVHANIFSYESTLSIASTKEYREGKILSMSYWSIIAVDVLDLHKDASVLDMCCAPGMKLVYAGVCLKALSRRCGEDAAYSITGCDISRSRLSVTEALVKKYKVGSVRLLLGDSAEITCAPVRKAGREEQQCRCSMDTPNAWCTYSATSLRKHGHSHSTELFDRIFVDPECSRTSTVKYLNNPVPGSKNYPAHQMAILRRAVSLLANNGVLVYSTCTFNTEENEEVTKTFLAEFPDIEEIDVEEEVRRKYGVSTRNKTPNNLLQGDSLFIAKFKLTRSTYQL
ncbi:hypothetical protein NECID01_0774 [Nematocida sp. AWRm77]|nr:hypothetical protein NECID01_0774 [Nematocida sp. AWRm77]